MSLILEHAYLVIPGVFFVIFEEYDVEVVVVVTLFFHLWKQCFAHYLHIVVVAAAALVFAAAVGGSFAVVFSLLQFFFCFVFVVVYFII